MLLFIDYLTSRIFCLCVFWGHGGYHKDRIKLKDKSPHQIHHATLYTHFYPDTEAYRDYTLTLNCKVHMC